MYGPLDQGCQSCSWSAAEQGKRIIRCPRSRLRIWSRETGSAVPSRVSLLIPILQAESSASLRDSPRIPRRRPFIIGVCVCFLPIHSGHQVRWTYQPGSHRRKVTQEEGHTGFLIHLPSAVRALIFVARRIQPFLSLVDREVEFCVVVVVVVFSH